MTNPPSSFIWPQRAQVIHSAVAARDLEALQALLSLSGFGPQDKLSDKPWRTLLDPASLVGSSIEYSAPNILAFLLARGASALEEPNRHPLGSYAKMAAENQDRQGECLAILALAGCAWHFTGGPCHDQGPLALAARRGLSRGVQGLVDAGYPIDALDSNGDSAIFEAFGFSARSPDHLECVKILARAGAKVDLPNRLGMTPLACACSAGGTAILDHPENLLEMLKTATEIGCGLDTAGFRGTTPISLLADGGALFALRFLSQAGLNRDPDWPTAQTMQAIQEREREIRESYPDGCDFDADLGWLSAAREKITLRDATPEHERKAAAPRI